MKLEYTSVLVFCFICLHIFVTNNMFNRILLSYIYLYTLVVLHLLGLKIIFVYLLSLSYITFLSTNFLITVTFCVQQPQNFLLIINHTILKNSDTYKSESYIIHNNFGIIANTVIFYVIYSLITFYHLVKFEFKNFQFFFTPDESDNSWFKTQTHFSIFSYKFYKKCYPDIFYMIRQNKLFLLKCIKIIPEEKTDYNLLCVQIMTNLALKIFS